MDDNRSNGDLGGARSAMQGVGESPVLTSEAVDTAAELTDSSPDSGGEDNSKGEVGRHPGVEGAAQKPAATPEPADNTAQSADGSTPAGSAGADRTIGDLGAARPPVAAAGEEPPPKHEQEGVAGACEEPRDTPAQPEVGSNHSDGGNDERAVSEGGAGSADQSLQYYLVLPLEQPAKGSPLIGLLIESVRGLSGSPIIIREAIPDHWDLLGSLTMDG